MTATRTRKPAAAPTRTMYFNPLVGCLILTVGKEESGYWIDRLPHDLGQAMQCVRLTKFAAGRRDDDQPNYDVQVNAETGERTCECRGFLRHHHCKHSDAVKALIESGRLI